MQSRKEKKPVIGKTQIEMAAAILVTLIVGVLLFCKHWQFELPFYPNVDEQLSLDCIYNLMNHMKIFSVGNDHVRARCRSNLGSYQFRCHAASSHLTSGRAFAHLHKMIIQIFYNTDKLRIRILMRIIRIQSVNI